VEIMRIVRPTLVVVIGVIGSLLVVSLLLSGGLSRECEADCQDDSCDDPPCCNGDVNADGRIDIADAVALLMYLFVDGTEPEAIENTCVSCPLAATRLTTCYDMLGNVIDCDNPDFPGQDGFYQTGCCPYPQIRFVDNEDETITDHCTGLTWAKAPSGHRMNWQQALKYCEDSDLAGYEDWRLPNMRELHSLVVADRGTPTIDALFDLPFAPDPDDRPAWSYWSSTSGLTDMAMYVYFSYGGLRWGTKTNLYRAWPVRGP
jgi:hypothetical protein